MPEDNTAMPASDNRETASRETTFAPVSSHFQCDRDEIDRRIDAIDPRAYDKTRNHLSGSVTWMGPFLTHGIIDTTTIATRVLDAHKPSSCYRLLFELAWREFFHRTWQLEGDAIFSDMRGAQMRVTRDRIPEAVLDGQTGIDTIDRAVAHLTTHGLMHNHARMWIAAICCNLGRTAWFTPARWLHHHLLDGDLASNTLSWQWIAGTFSAKQYVANQDNINRFSDSRQSGTWLDVPYEAFDDFPVPDVLQQRTTPVFDVNVRGEALNSQARPSGRIALRSIWNLDPHWQPDIEQHIVFVDVDWLADWPLSDVRWRFIEHWAQHCGATLVHGTLSELVDWTSTATVIRREYPACEHWPGDVEQRRWLFELPEKAFPSFSRYWKQVRGGVGL